MILNQQEVVMDVGGIDGVEIYEKYYKLQSKMDSHLTELKRIQQKLGNPRVPVVKKEKLRYRMRVITNQVIPRTRDTIDNILAFL
ncbi:hypothetical protein KJ586_00150 [Patescibacteria group bacterium]|nr:hypothetical protein [Patescibacteria group bacterium]MBU4454915.1 hypothetical protein [Patescibacteria group bacterium]